MQAFCYLALGYYVAEAIIVSSDYYYVIKFLVVLVFVAVFIGVALMVFRTWKENRKPKNSSKRF